ncbi:MAG: 50S ribosomal protein L16 [bacterium]
MLLPKKVKHRKAHLRKWRGKASQKIALAFGSFGLKALESGWVTSRQIESARRAMTRFVARGGKIWIRIFPDQPITNHGNESVMGSGKGNVDFYVAIVKAGTILFEMEGVTEKTAIEAMRLASHKLPLTTKFIKKNSNE